MLASFLRLYRLRETMQFLGDQGRDALIVRDLIINHNLVFIGPRTSVGDLFLGPLYYYFMAFPLMITYPDPSGPTYAVALLGILTVALMYILGKKMIGQRAALFATFLYAISPVVINNVRFSWNPNIVGLFTVLFLYSLWRAVHKSYWHWSLAGLWFAVLFQLHYITLILGGFAVCVWVYSFIRQIKTKKVSLDFVKATGTAIGIFLLSLVPLLLFDLRHDLHNVKGFAAFFVGSNAHVGATPTLSALFYSFVGLFLRTTLEVFGFGVPNGMLLLLFFVGMYLFIRSSMKRSRIFVGAAFLFSVGLLTLYKGSIYDHYLGFVIPIAILSLGCILDFFWQRVWYRPLVIGLVLLFTFNSVRKYPGFANLGLNIGLYKRTSVQIASRLPDDRPYAVLTNTSTGDTLGTSYGYFLTTLSRPPLGEYNLNEAQTLVIIDEMHSDKPIQEFQYLVAIWPNRTIVQDFSISNGPRVLILQR